MSDWEEITDDVDCTGWEESAVDKEETKEQLHGMYRSGRFLATTVPETFL